ncbi:thioredoxin [Clostridium sp. CAG:575]|nr:thioredoxin [Clostridium sp. CAG:575]
MELKLNSENFESEVLNANEKVLVDFYADWCGPCKMMAPVIEELAEELQGKAKVGKINVDESTDTATQYDVMSIPTIIIFKNGKEVKRFIGVRDKQELLNEVVNA